MTVPKFRSGLSMRAHSSAAGVAAFGALACQMLAHALVLLGVMLAQFGRNILANAALERGRLHLGIAFWPSAGRYFVAMEDG